MADKSICKVEGCGKKHFGHGWCQAHYTRWRRHGDPVSGRVSSGEPEQYFHDVVLPYDGNECLIWPYGRNTDGYGVLSSLGGSVLVSRHVCEEVYGPSPTSKHEAAHSCGKGHLACVTKRHLSWKTRQGNAEDMIEHGRSTRGERHACAKLTEPEVRQIIALKGTKFQREIAKQFGVSRSLINLIHARKTWAWLE